MYRRYEFTASIYVPDHWGVMDEGSLDTLLYKQMKHADFPIDVLDITDVSLHEEEL